MLKHLLKNPSTPDCSSADSKSKRNYEILSQQYGQYKSIETNSCVDEHGQPIPWYTYPAIDYIRQLDFKNSNIFEYGSGNSTLFWSMLCNHLYSVEDDISWYNKTSKNITKNTSYNYQTSKQEYVNQVNEVDQSIDVIIIDGNHRYECARESAKVISSTGFIILDNSDWFEKTSKYLRDLDFIEVDFTGFGPINNYTWTTSFYFSRNVKLTPLKDRQPIHGVGSLKYNEADIT